ncbi:hypothetical protein ONZ45_g18933 [Pleurotus djamor]|nr:hypothetical protein ONZ45_g18933 [Pleurotus djamor]
MQAVSAQWMIETLVNPAMSTESMATLAPTPAAPATVGTADTVNGIPAHEIVLVSGNDDENLALRQQCYKIRIDVFHHEQKFPLDTEIGDINEDEATHFLLRLTDTPDLTPVGTIRAYKSSPHIPNPYYKLTRLAVLKPYRQYKFGRELVEALHNWVKHDALTSKNGNLIEDTRTRHLDNPVSSNLNVEEEDTPGSDSSNSNSNSTANGNGNRNGRDWVQVIAHSQIPVKGFYAKHSYDPGGNWVSIVIIETLLLRESES